MKIALCFLAIVYSTVALPVEVPFDALEELHSSNLISKNLYVVPVNPAKTIDLPHSRIVGGVELTPGSAPYQAAIIVDDSFFCSGSLISTTRILTVAHCTVSASYVEVRLGAHNYTQIEATQVRLTSTNIVTHENYGENVYDNDISVIILPSVVTLTNSIQVIPLAAADADTYAGSWGFLAGWGITTDSSVNVPVDALRGVYLNVITTDECRGVYGNVVLDSHICTSGISAGIAGGCSGDNGSPLVVDGNQVGMVSYFSVNCESGYPTGFTRISSFRSWITQNAGV